MLFKILLAINILLNVFFVPKSFALFFYNLILKNLIDDYDLYYIYLIIMNKA